jgi:hypothetical protein
MNARPFGSTRRLWSIWPVVAMWGLHAGLGLAEPPAMKDAATHEQLVAQLRKAQQEAPVKLLPAAQGGDPTRHAPADLLSQSDILCFGGIATLVPKRSVLRIPHNLAPRMRLAPDATLMGWAEFFAKNRGWITTVEVSQGQAEGKVALAEDLTKSLGDNPNLVVATYQGGPISLMPLKVPPPPPPPPHQTEKKP